MPFMVLPTRTTPKCTLTDHIYSFEGGHERFDAVSCGNIINSVSNHIPNQSLLVNNRVKSQANCPTVRPYSEQAEQQFRGKLLAVDWNEITRESEINNASDKLSATISSCFNYSFHKVRLSKSRAGDK
jgi:hypothetical protein